MDDFDDFNLRFYQLSEEAQSYIRAVIVGVRTECRLHSLPEPIITLWDGDFNKILSDQIQIGLNSKAVKNLTNAITNAIANSKDIFKDYCLIQKEKK